MKMRELKMSGKRLLFFIG